MKYTMGTTLLGGAIIYDGYVCLQFELNGC